MSLLETCAGVAVVSAVVFFAADFRAVRLFAGGTVTYLSLVFAGSRQSGLIIVDRFYRIVVTMIEQHARITAAYSRNFNTFFPQRQAFPSSRARLPRSSTRDVVRASRDNELAECVRFADNCLTFASRCDSERCALIVRCTHRRRERDVNATCVRRARHTDERTATRDDRAVMHCERDTARTSRCGPLQPRADSNCRFRLERAAS